MLRRAGGRSGSTQHHFHASGTITHKGFSFAHSAAPMISSGAGLGVSDLLLSVLPLDIRKGVPGLLGASTGKKPPVMALGDYHHHRVSFISHVMAFSSSNTVNLPRFHLLGSEAH